MPNTDEQLAQAIRTYQKGFNDAQMGRAKSLTGKQDYAYLLGYKDGAPLRQAS